MADTFVVLLNMLARSVFGLDDMVPSFLLEFPHVARAWSGSVIGLLGLATVASFSFNRGFRISPFNV